MGGRDAEAAFRHAARQLPWFSSAVLAARDQAGMPFAVRGRARAEDGVVRLGIAPDLDLRTGPASLLCASYDQRLWHQRSFLLRGSLEHDATGWLLRPERFVPGEGLAWFPAQLRRYRRTTRRYLARRGLQRPSVDWDRVDALWDEASRQPRRPEAPHGLPDRAQAAVRDYLMGELVTLTRDGSPVVWPSGAFFDPAAGVFRASSSIAMPAKVERIRRDPRVALLFSNPTFSDLDDPPGVLFQGEAEAPEQLWVPGHATWDAHTLTVFSRRPVGVELAKRNRVTRALFDWYLIRLPVAITPTRTLWWPHGHTMHPPERLPAPAAAHTHPTTTTTTRRAE